MRLLLDTHAIIWWTGGHPQLTAMARAAIEDPGNEVFVSAASAMEIATKFRLGKLPDAERLAVDFAGEAAADGFQTLSISVEHGQKAGELPILHKDPFDRFLIAQAIMEDLVLVSNEQLFDGFGVKRLW
ncbi:MAG: PIN domain-containing protein [Caulobacter sp.]|nr:PIN domain-containing protein [Caulobacter sp.]